MREATASSLASSKLEDATPIVAAEVGRYSLCVHLDVLEEVSRVVDIRKRLDGELRLEDLDEIRKAENAMRVELDPLRSDRYREVKHPPRAKHRMKASHSFQVALGIDRIAVASEPKVLQRMQAGDRVRDFTVAGLQLGEVGLPKNHIGDTRPQRTNVEYFDLAKRRDMGHKSVEPGSHIDVSHWRPRENATRDKEILVEVVAGHVSTLRRPVSETRIQVAERERSGARTRSFERAKIANEPTNAA